MVTLQNVETYESVKLGENAKYILPMVFFYLNMKMPVHSLWASFTKHHAVCFKVHKKRNNL